ncbi:MAG: hypothetical protein QNM02_08200 [Acidimicrobiia bacterium]|nr:hypothetical protein [Acidimicrobiia bacterium]
MALHSAALTAAAFTILSLTPLAGSTAHSEFDAAAETAGPVRHDATAAEAEIVDWAVGRFELAGLTLPSVEVSFSSDEADCGGHEGLYRRRDGEHLVTVCIPGDHPDADDYRRRTLLHELTHAWDQSSLTSDERDHLLPVLDVTDWYEADEWGRRGIERLAETFVFGLLDQPRRVLLIAVDCSDAYADFQAITGSTPLGPIPPLCVA